MISQFNSSNNQSKMNTIVCGILIIASASFGAKLDNTYLPPNSAQTAGGNGEILHTPQGEYGAPNHQDNGKYTVASVDHQQRQPIVEANFKIPQQTFQRPSPVYGPAQRTNPEANTNILRFDNDNDGNGNYHFDFETENKIRHEEHGQLKQVADGDAVVVQGSYSYVGDDGRTYTVTYIADENGFQPTGEHIDEAIARTAAEAAKSAVPDVREGGYKNYGNGGAVQQTEGGYKY